MEPAAIYHHYLSASWSEWCCHCGEDYPRPLMDSGSFQRKLGRVSNRLPTDWHLDSVIISMKHMENTWDLSTYWCFLSYPPPLNKLACLGWGMGSRKKRGEGRGKERIGRGEERREERKSQLLLILPALPNLTIYLQNSNSANAAFIL